MAVPPALRTTASMLAEIEMGSAAEAVMALRYTTCPPGSVFHHPLDKAILAARPHLGGSTLQRGDLIQVIGPSGSGKTSFLTFLLLTTLLPPSFILRPAPAESRFTEISIPLGGKGHHAALIHPHTHRSIIPSLSIMMKGHVLSCILNTLGLTIPTRSISAAVEEVTKESLRKLRVIKVKPRYKDWALAIRRLWFPPLSLHVNEDERGGGGLDLLICDGFADGYWPERWIEEERTSVNRGNGTGVSGTGKKRNIGIRGAEDISMRDVFEGLGKLRKEMGTVVVLSLQGVWHERKEATSSSHITPYYAPHLPPPFPNPWNDRTDNNPSTTLSRDPTFWPLNIELTMLGKPARMQFPAETMLIDALRSRSVQLAHQGGGSENYEALLRVTDGRGRGGSREGVGWKFSIGSEGFEAYPEEEGVAK